MIDLALRQGDILTLGLEKGDGWNASVQETEKGKGMETSMIMVLIPRAQHLYESQRGRLGGVTGKLSVLSVMTRAGWGAGFGSGLRVFRNGLSWSSSWILWVFLFPPTDQRHEHEDDWRS